MQERQQINGLKNKKKHSVGAPIITLKCFFFLEVLS